MKKLYTLIFASVFAFSSVNAATVTIGVGTDGTGTANQFFPATASAVVGDVIQFIAASGPHNVTSGSIPGGAAAMSHTFPAAFDTYSYTVTVAGTYNYSCTLHAGMTGVINVAASTAGIADPAVDLLTQAYPNPFSSKLTLKYNGIEKVELFNVVGEKVAAFELSATENKAELDLSDLSAGIYFYRTYRDGAIVETKKVVKK
ncbi:MAG: T9SS type A sorting domain-containing protein [Bacteroidia bacterium]